MLAIPRLDPAASDSALVTKALIRAADKLRVTNKALARVIGVSEATVSRMKKGGYPLEAGQKPFQLAVLFVRLYRSLDAMTCRQAGSPTQTWPSTGLRLNWCSLFRA
jgi:hypothetical protein